MKKTIQRILITVLVFSFILVPTSKVEAAKYNSEAYKVWKQSKQKYPYTDYIAGSVETYVGHTEAVLHSAPLAGSSVIKSVKVKNPKIASVKVDGAYIVVTGKKAGTTDIIINYKDAKNVTFGTYKSVGTITVYPNYISKSVRVRGKKISIGESLAQVKKDFGTKFKVIKDKGMKGKYLAYTDDMSKLLVVGICKDKVVEIYTTSSDWKSGNIGLGVKDPGKPYKNYDGYLKAVFTDYYRMSGFDDYLMNHPLQFIQHSVRSCSTSLDNKPRIYYLYRAWSVQGSSSYSLKEDYSTRHKVYDLLEKGVKAAAKSKKFTIQFTTDNDTL